MRSVWLNGRRDCLFDSWICSVLNGAEVGAFEVQELSQGFKRKGHVRDMPLIKLILFFRFLREDAGLLEFLRLAGQFFEERRLGDFRHLLGFLHLVDFDA
jgi:hypothetical protein